MIVTQALRNWLIEHKHVPWSVTDDQVFATKAAQLLTNGKLDEGTFTKLIQNEDEEDNMSKSIVEQAIGSRIRVKAPSEQYNEKRYTTTHRKFGTPVFDTVHQQECTTMSEGAKARHGVLIKKLASKAGLGVQLTTHESELLEQVCKEMPWAGTVNGEYYENCRGTKALLDDATSGGLEITPIEFDSDVITFPLLTGELYPRVNIRPVARGRRIEGASVSTPTLSWGGADNSEISLFTTTSMVAALDTTIHVVDGAIELGRDFLSDSPINVGDIVSTLIGQRLAEELDDVVANGNGTTQPEGFLNASGIGTVSSDNGVGGPWTLGDFESVLFGLEKQYRTQQMGVTFVSNDTTFLRSRQLAVDASGANTDIRPVMMPSVDGINRYSTLGWPHAIQADIANGTCAVVALAKYRMYRRLGLELRFETGGSYLQRRNLALLVYRARFGGRLMDPSACAVITDGQS